MYYTLICIPSPSDAAIAYQPIENINTSNHKKYLNQNLETERLSSWPARHLVEGALEVEVGPHRDLVYRLLPQHPVLNAVI